MGAAGAWFSPREAIVQVLYLLLLLPLLAMPCMCGVPDPVPKHMHANYDLT